MPAIDMFVSADIEADGPIPGLYSMLSLGLCVAATFDGVNFVPRDPTRDTFYRELKPISQNFDANALKVSGLDRAALGENGSDPAAAMREAGSWLKEKADGFNLVMVGYPIVFDWMFIHWYFVRFVGESPFGFSNALDMKTMFQQKAYVTLESSGLSDLPSEIASSRRHTHNAMEDAIDQAVIFNRLFVWQGIAGRGATK
jgi:hypothetical protein